MNETGALAQMETTELDRALAEIARLTAINADLCAVNLRHAEAIARLNAALAEVDEIHDTVVLIHEREATARQEEREACKAEIARLSEALDGALAADWSSLRETLARQEEREACAELFKAKIAELEAEVERLTAALADVHERWNATSRELGIANIEHAAHRAELEAALTNIANSGARQHDFAIPADHVTWAIHRARAALSGEGVTT